MPFSALTEITKDKEREAGKDIKTSVPSVSPCETFYTSHAVFRSHGDHRGHGGGSRKSVEKPQCETLPLTESTKAKERGVGKDIKTSVPSVPPCETFYTSHAVFRSHGDHRGHGEGGRKSVEKPQCETLPLTEFTRAKERGVGKDIKTSVPSVPPCETFYTSHAVFRSHGDHRGHGGGSRKSVEKPQCETLPLTESTKNTEGGAVKA